MNCEDQRRKIMCGLLLATASDVNVSYSSLVQALCFSLQQKDAFLLAGCFLLILASAAEWLSPMK